MWEKWENNIVFLLGFSCDQKEYSLNAGMLNLVFTVVYLSGTHQSRAPGNTAKRAQ
jgi:hypothetical protein